MSSKPCRLSILILLALLWTTTGAAGQSHRLVPLDSYAYDYIDRLQRRGHLLSLHPTALPYTYGEVESALDAVDTKTLTGPSRRWFDALTGEFSRDASRRRTVFGAELQPGARLSTSPRLDPLRPAFDGEATLEAGSISVFPNVSGRLFAEYGPIVAQAGLRFDLFYRDDPDGLAAANRLITRNEDAYAGIDTRFVSAYVGRLSHHWAPRGETGLLISDNPAGYDQLYLRLGSRRFGIRSILGELDSMTGDGRFTGAAGADSVGSSIRRFVSAHRFDWRPSRHVAVSLMESTVYSSATSGLSLKYLNPLALHAFAVDGRPKNDENNGILAGMLWLHAGRWTLQGQLLVDDLDIARTTGEPAAVALSGNVVFAGLERADLGADLTAVATRTYNTHQPEGRYTHLLRGLGAPYTDYAQAGAYSTVYFVPWHLDVAVTPRIDVLFQGAGEIHMPYPDSQDHADTILLGTVAQVIRPALQLRLQHGRTWWLQLDAGPAFIRNERNIRSNDRTVFTMTVALTTRLTAGDSVSH
ncbi:MAG: hypothetical protein WD021_01875 [Rhodothermales bacterium]